MSCALPFSSEAAGTGAPGHPVRRRLTVLPSQVTGLVREEQYPCGVKLVTSRPIMQTDEDHIFRRARREDIRRCMPLWARDRVLYDPEVWVALPALLEQLFDRELISFALIESVRRRVPRLLGGIAFIRPEYVSQSPPGRTTVLNTVMSAAMEGGNPFLSPREVGEGNARGELHLLNFFGNMDVIDLSDPQLANFYRTSNEGHRFFHFGYSLSAMWMEVSTVHHAHELRQIGMHLEREIPLVPGSTATLMRLTRQDALANPYARFSGYFFPPAPRFTFSMGEQSLLERALLDDSDDVAAAALHVSGEAIQKRWRSIYAKTAAVDPHLLLPASSGTARRKAVLHYLRQHLEELRPYRKPK